MVKALNKKIFPALRGIMGQWVYYNCLMKFSDLVDRVNYAKEIHTNKNLSDMLQRELKDGKRGKEIADYLLKDKDHFLGSLVVAVYGGEPKWYQLEDFKEMPEGLSEEDISSDVENSVGFLELLGTEKIFALDGQHRLAGIRHLLENNLHLNEEEVSVIMVAHDNETKEGLIRSRKLFTNLNKHAVPVGQNEIIALDENDAIAIITRKLVEECDYFKGNRIKFKGDSLSTTDRTELTTIRNLYDILANVSELIFNEKKVTIRQSPRPDDEKIDLYYKNTISFFKFMGELFPDLGGYLTTDDPEKVVAKCRIEGGGHILFRPLGWQVISEVIGSRFKTLEALQNASSVLKKLPYKFNEAPLKGLIWDEQKNKPYPKGKAICRDILLYMIGYNKNKVAKLKERSSKIQNIDIEDVIIPKKITE